MPSLGSAGGKRENVFHADGMSAFVKMPGEYRNSDRRAERRALVESTRQRRLAPWDEAKAMERAMDLSADEGHVVTQSRLADEFHCKQPKVSKRLALARLPEVVGELAGHAFYPDHVGALSDLEGNPAAARRAAKQIKKQAAASPRGRVPREELQSIVQWALARR